MAAVLLAVLSVGGWITTIVFQVLLSFAVTLLGNFADAEGQVSAWVWVPSACVVILIWLTLVVLPALWAVLSFVGSLLGIVSAIRPSIAAAPQAVLFADAAARLAMWIGFGFGSEQSLVANGMPSKRSVALV